MQMNEFREAVIRDQALQARLRLARTNDEIVALASSAGYAIEVQDIELANTAGAVRMSEPELETVAGALPCWCDPSVVDSKSCG